MHAMLPSPKRPLKAPRNRRGENKVIPNPSSQADFSAKLADKTAKVETIATQSSNKSTNRDQLIGDAVRRTSAQSQTTQAQTTMSPQATTGKDTIQLNQGLSTITRTGNKYGTGTDVSTPETKGGLRFSIAPLAVAADKPREQPAPKYLFQNRQTTNNHSHAGKHDTPVNFSNIAMTVDNYLMPGLWSNKDKAACVTHWVKANKKTTQETILSDALECVVGAMTAVDSTSEVRCI